MLEYGIFKNMSSPVIFLLAHEYSLKNLLKLLAKMKILLVDVYSIIVRGYLKIFIYVYKNCKKYILYKPYV